MKILLCTLEYPPHKGGVANYYHNLKLHWPENEKFLVLSNNNDKLLCKKKLPLKWLKSLFSIYKYYKQKKVDYLLVGQILPLGTSALILKKLFNINYGVVIHGMDFSYAIRSKRKKILTKKILKNAEQVISANTYTKELMLNFLPEIEEKIKVVNPGVKGAEIDRQTVKRLENDYNLQDKLVIYSLGRLVKRKGFDLVIKAIERLDKNIKDNLIYVVSGGGPEEENLKKQAEDKGFKIIFTDSITDTEKWSWLHLCDIFVMPSRNIKGDFEGFGIVFLEASLTKTPAIGSMSGGIKDAISDKESGFLITENDISALADKIKVLAINQELREKMGNYAYLRAKNKFDWSEQTKLFYKILNS